MTRLGSFSGFAAFFAKELRETWHTWRIWVLPGLIIFSAISSPIITYLTPDLIRHLGSSQQGVVIQVSTPTAQGAYLEYLGNLGELVMFALVIAYGGIISSEVRSGTGALALTKPLSRSSFVLTKWLSQLLVIVVAAALATGGCIAVTIALLGTGPALQAATAAALWLAYAAAMLSAMVLLSAALRAPAAASGAGVGVYAALVVLAQFKATSRVTPAGLIGAGQALLRGDPAHWVAPLVSAAIVSAACLAVAVWRFSRREI